MAGGKTSKQETESEQKRQVDKSLVRDYGELMDSARSLATMRTQPNRGVTIAGLTPAQLQSMQSTNDAAGAFGMGTASFGMPQTQRSASGIQGYSTAPEFDAAVSALPDGYKKAMGDYYSSANGNASGGTPVTMSSGGTGKWADAADAAGRSNSGKTRIGTRNREPMSGSSKSRS